MTIPASSLREAVTDYCAILGEDPLLVQGAGGNVSWKESDVLWVKASGKWLAEAKKEDIFVPVDLQHLRERISSDNFAAKPRVLGDSPLRPSIETLLHALMPHRVVVHLHPVDILAHLVRVNCESDLAANLDASLAWLMVGYHKPGADLALAVSEALTRQPGANIVFLRNHGVVIGGADIAELSERLTLLLSSLTVRPAPSLPVANVVVDGSLPPSVQGYSPVEDPLLQSLARDAALFERVRTSWALYPDHVVFLGPRAHCCDSLDAIPSAGDGPELIFVKDVGVFSGTSLTEAKLAQLQCYYDVIVRQPSGKELETLGELDIRALLDWDAETYRQSIRP